MDSISPFAALTPLVIAGGWHDVNTRATLTPPLKPLTPMISLEKVRIAEGSRFARNVTPSRKRIHMHDQ
jgi:hypothetical protein